MNHLQDAPIFRFPIRVYYAQSDAAGIVYHANYLDFMEACRMEWLRAVEIDPIALQHEEGIVFLIRAASLEYLAPARVSDLLMVSAQLKEVGRSRLHIAHEVWRDETLICKGEVTLVCVHLPTGRSMAVPEAIKNAFMREIVA